MDMPNIPLAITDFLASIFHKGPKFLELKSCNTDAMNSNKKKIKLATGALGIDVLLKNFFIASLKNSGNDGRKMQLGYKPHRKIHSTAGNTILPHTPSAGINQSRL